MATEEVAAEAVITRRAAPAATTRRGALVAMTAAMVGTATEEGAAEAVRQMWEEKEPQIRVVPLPLAPAACETCDLSCKIRSAQI